MLFKNSKATIIIGMLFACLFGTLLGFGLKTFMSEVGSNATQHARRTIRVEINQSQWDDLFNHLQTFAEKWRYAIRIAPLDPNGNSYKVEMWRVDMRVTAFMDVSFDNGDVQIHFYDTDPDRPNPDSYFDDELDDLIDLIEEVPNVTITEER